jgi:predicted nucleotidyltransferase
MYGHDTRLFGFVARWCETYTKLYYLPPLPYVDDKARPSDAFRLKVDKSLHKLAGLMPNTFEMDSSIVLDSILEEIGKKLSYVDLSVIPHVIDVDRILVGGSYAFNRATKWSDLDVYVLAGDNTSTKESMVSALVSVLGIKVDLHLVAGLVVWDYLLKQGFKEITKEKQNDTR